MRVTRLLLVLLTVAAMATAVSARDIIWDGGAGQWHDANWNGGLTAASIIGRDDGSRNTDDIIQISGAGANVTYTPSSDGRGFVVNQGVEMWITNGATFNHFTPADDTENAWTIMDMSKLVIDNGTYKREGRALAHPSRPGGDDGGGSVIFGSWRAKDKLGSLGQAIIDVSITNGGKFDNEGQLWFGAYLDQPNDVVARVTVNNGDIDLHGGEIDLDNSGIAVMGDLIFTYIDANRQEDYSINFTGPGSITVDSSGIKIVEGAGSGQFFVDEDVSYEMLWNLGLLRANGLSGLSENAPAFGSQFTVSGTPGQDNYKLFSNVVPANPTDLNGDGAVDAADAGIMFGDWGGPGSTSPADFNDDGFVDAADAGTMFEAWTGDPATPAAKAATAEYNPETGELKISSAGAVNVFVQSASNAITPINPAPAVPVGLLTNNTGRVGITNLGPIEVTNFSFGNIGKGLAMSDLKLVYTTALGTKGIEVPAGSSDAFKYIPEPASFGLIGLGLAGLLAARRRS